MGIVLVRAQVSSNDPGLICAFLAQRSNKTEREALQDSRVQSAPRDATGLHRRHRGLECLIAAVYLSQRRSRL